MALWLSVILPYFLSATVLGQSSSTPRNTTAGWNATTSYGTHSSEHTSSGETLSEESSQKTVSSWSSRDVSGLPSSGPRSPDSDSVSGLGALILSGLGPIVPAETSKAETLTTVSTSGMAPAAYSSNSSQIGLGSKILEGLEPEITKATGFGGQSSSSAPLHSLNETVSVTQITQLSTARLSVFPENITQSEISRSTTTNLSSMSTTFANPRSTSERNSSTLTVTNTRSAQLTAPHIKPNTTDGASKVGLSRNASERNSSSLTVTNTGAAQFTASQIKPNITDGASRVGLSRNNSERDSSTLMVTNTRAAQMTGSHIKPNTTDGASRVGLSRNTFERNSSILTVTNTRAAQMTASHIEPNTTDGASRVGLRSNTSIKYNTTESKFSGNQPARFDTSINRQLNATARSGWCSLRLFLKIAIDKS
ncbi:MAG: hypothetical protein M1836_006381 [Candelina mexicana]|nr:MAG: hypothetical protein M1836_006381 [Candelina mexicana]